MTQRQIDGVTWLLIRDGRILLERCPKKAEKLGVGEWFVPGGKVEGEESVEYACYREMHEEWPGIKVGAMTPLPVLEGSPVGTTHEGIFLMRPFLVEVEGQIPQQSADGVELRWCSIIEALASPVPQVRMMVAAAVDYVRIKPFPTTHVPPTYDESVRRALGRS